jgi:hypothetical protein
MTRKMLDRHPLSALSGDYTPEEFLALQDSIASDGVQEKVQIFEGMILDGWNRYSIAAGLGMDCPTEEFAGTLEEAKAFVLRKHTRRNWTPSQRAACVAAIRSWLPGGRPKSAPPENPAPGAEFSTEQLAAEARVSPRTMERAKTVARKAVPQVQKAVIDGDVSLKKAEKIAALPKKDQEEALKRPAWRPVPPVPRPVVGATMDAFAEMKEKQAILAEEVDRLTDRLAVACMEATDEERRLAAETLAELRATVKRQEAEIRALTSSRDTYMTECSELRKQCATYRNQLTRSRQTA